MMRGKGPLREILVLVSNKHHCFLCLEKVKEQVTEVGQVGGAGGSQGGNRITTSVHSIQKLCHHLKLDIDGKGLSNDKDKNVGGGGEGHQEDLTVELCQDCVELVGEFSKAFQELEEVKRKVASILGGIHGKLQGAEKSGRTEQYRRLIGGDAKAKFNRGVGGEDDGPGRMVEALRMKMMDKCVRKLRGVGVPVPSPTQSSVPEELPSEPGKSTNMEESAEVDPRTASICEDDLVNYQLVGVYDVKLEPVEPEESPGPDAVPEDDVNVTCGANGFVAMETGIDGNLLMGPAPSISATAKSNGQAATMNILGETNCDPHPRDHSQQKNSSGMNALPDPDFPFAQVIEMFNVKLEPEEQIPLPEDDGEAFRNNDLAGETEGMPHHPNHVQSHSPSPMVMDSRMEVTTSSGYGSDCSPLSQTINDSSFTQVQSSPGDFGPLTPAPPPRLSFPGGGPQFSGQLCYDDGDDNGPKMVATDLLEVSWDLTPSTVPDRPLENGGRDQLAPEVNHHHTKAWIPPTTQVRLADISCAACHLKLTLPLDGPNSHKCSANANTKSSVSGPLEGNTSSVTGPVKPSSSAQVPQKSSPEPSRPHPVAVPPPGRVFSGDGTHNKPLRRPKNPVTDLYDCCCCTKEFGHYGGLYCHHRSVHLGEKFNCPWPGCHGSFTRSDYYRIHYRSVHLGISPPKPTGKKRKRGTTWKL